MVLGKAFGQGGHLGIPGRLQSINQYGGISASSQQYRHIQMSALTLEIRQKEEARRRAWGTLQWGFVFFHLGRDILPRD